MFLCVCASVHVRVLVCVFVCGSVCSVQVGNLHVNGVPLANE